MADQDHAYVRYMYERYQGRIAIGVGYRYDMSEIFPFVFENPDKEALGIVAMSPVDQEKGSAVYIFHFSTFATNCGNGRIMLGELCRMADQFYVSLSLSPFTLPNGNNDLMSSMQLESWYASFGFSGSACFRREPHRVGEHPA